MAALAQNGDGLRADQAGAADDDDLHHFTFHDGFEAKATPRPLATGSRSRSIRRMERVNPHSSVAVARIWFNRARGPTHKNALAVFGPLQRNDRAI